LFGHAFSQHIGGVAGDLNWAAAILQLRFPQPYSSQAGHVRRTPGFVGSNGEMAAPEGEAIRRVVAFVYATPAGFNGSTPD
jgi:hypothetical protein